MIRLCGVFESSVGWALLEPVAEGGQRSPGLLLWRKAFSVMGQWPAVFRVSEKQKCAWFQRVRLFGNGPGGSRSFGVEVSAAELKIPCFPSAGTEPLAGLCFPLMEENLVYRQCVHFIEFFGCVQVTSSKERFILNINPELRKS